MRESCGVCACVLACGCVFVCRFMCVLVCWLVLVCVCGGRGACGVYVCVCYHRSPSLDSKKIVMMKYLSLVFYPPIKAPISHRPPFDFLPSLFYLFLSD